MNDSESAGGGHQGSTPAPPAVTDYKTILSAAPTVTSSSSSTNQTAPSVLTIVTTNARTTVTPTSSITSVSSGTSRNFQLVFTQQSPTPQQQLQQQHKPKLATTQLAPKAIVGVQQKQQYSASHMPQTSSSRLATGANSQPTITSRVKSSYTPVNQTDVKDITGESIPLAKRQKVDLTPDSVVGNSASIVVGSLLPATGSTVAPSIATAPTPQDINALKKRILEHKYLRLRSLKEKHNENVAELFYLQNGGNMMDFPTWRKKPHTPQFISFSNAFRLEQLIHDEKAAAAAVSASQQQNVENIATIIGVSGTIGQHQLKQQKQVETSNTPTTASAKAQVSPTAPVTIPSSINPDTPKSTKTPAGSIDNNDSLISDSSNSPLPQGAEIKIPSVGATPVAVSTKLPAAVVQLSQQGGTPLVPCSTANGSSALRRNGNGISQIINASPGNVPGAQVNHRRATPPPAYAASPSGALAPSTTNGSSAAQSASGANASNAQEFSFKAKQEVYVLQRISELQREGLWTEKRLPKLQEPSRPKAHWDYLLEEMVWLAADFAQERKWKKNAAKKCAKMVQKYFQDKASAAQKAEKAQEAHLKRIAAFISKEVKMFWSNVEKLVEYKHHTKLEEKRKKALDQHLSFIVDQTEKFSQQLAEGMNKNIQETTNPLSSVISSRKSSPKSESVHMTDDDFRPDSASDDDEETIAKADEEEASNVKEEVAALEKESQMDLDDFINELPKGYLENRDKILPEVSPKGNEKDDTDGDFEAGEESADDENTIDEQEEEEMDVDHQKELDELEADNDLTVAQLMERYKSDKPTHAKSQILVDEKSTVSADSDDDEQEESVDSDDFSEADTDDETVEETASEAEEIEQEDCLKSLLEENETHTNSKDDMIKDAAALAESLQPKGNTLSSTNVVTPVPFLLKHSLREYQHIGLDWLVTMNERKLNGILADEMGLGKTIQTIALLAHLACVKGNWGPHLIVVPSSVMLNWEMEFKKWCPGFKILTYYGTQKERKMKRVGWTKPNAFHVCISSYKLVVQDQQSFRRKKWKYLILDEAQNIKNFKSQRWQLLLNFSTERRLLLTGTPLQNDLMELWSLMHFLMPYVFSSHREFKEWFSNPMTGMIEGNMEYNETLITRLHKVIRPFLLRRLKKEVEKQMPKKYEHVIMCRLSNRQRYLYDDFMSRAKTKETLQTGNLLSVINVLMQLRKVCNHPNMFEVRPTISPFQMEGIGFETARLVCDLMEYDPFSQIDLCTLNLLLVKLELTLSAYVSHKCRLLMPPRKLIEEIDTMAPMPPPCPTGKYKLYVRVRDQEIQTNLSTHGANIVRVGASPAMKTEGNKLVPTFKIDSANSKISKRITIINPLKAPRIIGPINISKTGAVVLDSSRLESSPQRMTTLTSTASITTAKLVKIVNPDRRQLEIRPIKPQTLVDTSTVTGRPKFIPRFARPIEAKPLSHRPANRPQKSKLVTTLVQQVKTKVKTDQTMDVDDNDSELADNTSEADPIYNMAEILQRRKEQRLGRLKLMAAVNKRRSEATPIYGEDCRESLRKCLRTSRMLEYSTWQSRGYTNCCVAMQRSDNWTLNTMIKTHETRCHEMKTLFANFILYVPPACAPRMRLYVRNLATTRIHQQREVEETLNVEISPKLRLLHPIMSAMTTQFPDPRLIQYDCGKLQTLDRLLRQLKSEQHRVLIFTQMTKMLDILEAFLNHHGHIYLRLDGATRVEQRQVLMERFNGDKRIFCFILSTRSGGVGVNLTGADTVIFYDSDWNPTMDAQAQDRCHRIGQTRDVHIYRLVSEKTIEVNILKKANQKRMLSDMAIEGGNFTTTYFKSSTIKDLFDMEQQGDIEIDASVSASNKLEKPATEVSSEGDSEKHSLRAFETALAAAEDEQDVQATKTAKAEVAADLAEFDETIPIDEVQVEGTVELSKADLEVQNLVKQLSPIERYAMRFVEETGAAWTAEQLRAAEEEIEAQKREWEANRLAALQKEEELLKQEAEAEEMMTYSRKDASNQVNKIQDSSSKTNISIKSKKLLKRRLISARKSTAGTLASEERQIPATRALNREPNQISAKGRQLADKKLKNHTILSRSVSNSSISQNGVLHAKATPSAGKRANVKEIRIPLRRVTRTSIAAFAFEELPTKSNLSTANKRTPSKTTVEARSSTGVKNQKLLKMASKQLNKRRVANNMIAPKRRKTENVSQRNQLMQRNTNRKLRNSSIKAPSDSEEAEDDEEEDNDENEGSEEEERKDEEESDVKDEEDEETENDEDGGSEGEDEDEDENEDEDVGKTDDNEFYESETNEQSVDSHVDEDCTDSSYTGGKSTNRLKVFEPPKLINSKKSNTKRMASKPFKTEKVEQDSDENELDDTSSYSTAIDKVSEDNPDSNSMEAWNAHAQLQDTTTTSSTYFNVSEEDSEVDDDTFTSQTTTSRKIRNVKLKRNSEVAEQQNFVDVNSPRTRSRGSVKINLWTLDVSPVLPGVKPQVMAKNGTKKDNLSRLVCKGAKQKLVRGEGTQDVPDNNALENSDEDSDNLQISDHEKNKKEEFTSTPLKLCASGSFKRSVRPGNVKRLRNTSRLAEKSPANEIKSTGTLHRWLVKTTRLNVRQNYANVGEKSDDSDDSTESISNSLHPANNGPL